LGWDVFDGGVYVTAKEIKRGMNGDRELLDITLANLNEYIEGMNQNWVY
jgi:hypothetical protein